MAAERHFLPALLVFLPLLAQPLKPPICATCHRDKWDAYRHTGMGRSFSPPSPQSIPSAPVSYFHAPSQSYFSIYQRDGRFFQRRHQLDAAGREIHVFEKQIDYVLGSGNHARTFLHRAPNGALLELPLGWYAENGGTYAMNPGYDRPDHEGFRRLISYDCMFCHNAYPAIPAGHEQPLSQPVYLNPIPQGIDCQRCHGDGGRHVKLASSGAARPRIRAAIVNPARLSPDRRMEICMVCHLEPTSFPLPNALLRYNRGPFSFRPGEPMGDFILTFDHAPGSGRQDKFEIVNAAYRLRRSACFRSASGKLTCTTCHDPHSIPRGEAAVRHYDQVCRQCHAASIPHYQQQDCASCHMPKRRTEDVVHSLATDHLIQRRKPAGDLLAERPERHETGSLAYRGPVVLYYPEKLPPTPGNELYLAVAQVKQNSNLAAGIVQLIAAIGKHRPARAEFYVELAEALERAGRVAESVPVLRDALSRAPNSAPILQRLATALRRAGQPAEALPLHQRATTVAPNAALNWHELGQTYRTLNRPQDAIAAMLKALELDPDLPEAHNNLGVLYLSLNDPARAESALRRAVTIKPEYPDARLNLANLLVSVQRDPEARGHFEAALRLRPGDSRARYSYALLLGRTGHPEIARRQLETALRTDPEFPDAHATLGDLLAASQQWPQSITHYRAALRFQPGNPRYQFSLGAALAASGDPGAALPHLQKAAAAADPAIRRQAAALLERLQPAR